MSKARMMWAECAREDDKTKAGGDA